MATLESLNFPILPSGQMNPFHQALSSGLDTYQNMVKTAYAAPTAQADIASKAAYATYSPYSYLAKAFSDPTSLAILAQHPDQFESLMNKFSSIPTNPYASIMGSSTQGQDQKSKSSDIWNKIKNAVGLGDNQDFGANNKASPEEVQDIINRSQPNRSNQMISPIYSQSNVPQGTSSDYVNHDYANLMDPNNVKVQAYIKAFPNSPQALEVKTQNELWQKRIQDQGNNVDQTQNALTTLKAMKNVYPQLKWYEKGAVFGNTYGISSKAQLMDRLAKTQSTNNLRALQTGHITNTDFAIGDKLKPGRELNEESFNKMENYNEALALRAKQKQFFDTEAKKIMPIEKADYLWSKFVEDHPLFDSESEKLNMKNAKMSPFEALKNNKKTSSDENLGSESDQGQMPPKGTIWMRTPEGYRVPVHETQIENAKKRGLTEVE